MKKVDPRVEAARDAEEAAWRAYVAVRATADVEAARRALVAYQDAMTATDEAVEAAG